MPKLHVPEEIFGTKPERIGRPRLGLYHKLFSRFYEAIVMLSVLGQSRGNHAPATEAEDVCKTVRRRFLRNLAYICDFDKLSDTCTAIGLEEKERCYVFWVASNKRHEGTTQFLSKALDYLQEITELPSEELEAKRVSLLKHCLQYSKLRIGKERECLLGEVKKCLEKLGERALHEDPFRLWLSNIQKLEGDLEVCEFAYNDRKSENVTKLLVMATHEQRKTGYFQKLNCFASARHYIGRLSRHIRVFKQLCEDASPVSYVLQSFEVRSIEPMLCGPTPTIDNHTNLPGILGRMLGKNFEEQSRVEEGLRSLNQIKRIFKDFISTYQNLKPVVHAEIQVLEHFYNSKLNFAGNDRFIACSKPACLCCEMYFKHHPARMVVPESHRKIYPNWGLPLVPDFCKQNQEARRQRDILNKMICEIRGYIISQSLGQAEAGSKRRDSLTEISISSRLGA